MRFTHAAPAVLATALIVSAAPAGAAQQITGAGSTLAQPVYGKWAELAAAETGVTLNYQGVGSGAGQKLVIARTVDFGATDAPLSAQKLKPHRLLQFPTVIGAVDIAVNLPGIASETVRLSGPLLAAIYTGAITNWNDPAIARENPGTSLPDLPVAPIYRADGSGTTFVFTSYLARVDPGFKDKVGAATSVSWPAGTGAKGTAGVAAAVKHTRGGIGYVESAYATLNHLTVAQLRAHDGQYLRPSPESFAAAAAATRWTASGFAVDMTDQPGPQSWPIVSPTFVLLPTDPTDQARAAATLKFFDWALRSGDAAARELQYVPLPEPVKAKVRAAWKASSAAR